MRIALKVLNLVFKAKIHLVFNIALLFLLGLFAKPLEATAKTNNNSTFRGNPSIAKLIAVNSWVGSYLNDVNYPLPKLSSNSKKIVVMLDPGHGGKDPGAMPGSNSSASEKNIVLQISKDIEKELLKNPEISVVLSRRGDYFIPLKDRILWAKRFNADLFISVHADRALTHGLYGLSVYTLSEKASDAQSQLIATNQNKSDLIAGGIDVSQEDSEVSRILISLLQRVKINDSVTLAKDVLSSASNGVKLIFNPLRSAGFLVLKVPETPAILIETGFLSNNTDVNNLTNRNYQGLMAQKIAFGVQQYLWQSGKLKKLPPGIRFQKN